MDKNTDIPYIVYEGTIARFERTIRRLILAIIVIVLLLFGSNMTWLYVWNQYDFSSEEITIENEDAGNANYMGANASGVINNGVKDQREAEDDNETGQE